MTNYINNATEVVVIGLANQAAPCHDATIAAGWHSGLTTGKFVGLNSSAQYVAADSDAATPIPAMGALVHDQRQSYSVMGLAGNKDYSAASAYDKDVKFKMAGGPTLTPGQPIWLSSGGWITQTYPTDQDKLRQQVGVALTSDSFLVKVGTPEINGKDN